MYSITLEVNKVCNLKCTYCYLGDKPGDRMAKETGIKAINMAFKQVTMHRDRTLWFDFVGGETLFDMELIKELVTYIEEKNQEEQYKLIFSLTTNATMLTEEIIDYLIEKKFSIKVSIDGKKEINDLNRISVSGESSHDQVVEKLDLLRKYEKETKKFVQVTNVVTGNNYKSYYETFRYLVEDLKFKIIDTALDTYYNWSDTQMNELMEQIRLCMEYYKNAVKEKNYFGWNYFDSMLEAVEKNQKFYYCGAGIISLYVNTDGTYFPCTGCLADEACLGNVEKGFDFEKITYLKELNSIDNEECNHCKLFDTCGEKGCVWGNLENSKAVNQPVKILCRLHKFLTALNQENQEFLEKYVPNK